MYYTLKLVANDGKYIAESCIVLDFPMESVFSTNMKTGNALCELVPLLLGEVINKLDILNNPEPETIKEEE